MGKTSLLLIMVDVQEHDSGWRWNKFLSCTCACCCFSKLFFLALFCSCWLILASLSLFICRELLALSGRFDIAFTRFYSGPLFFHTHLLTCSYTHPCAHTVSPVPVPLSRSLDLRACTFFAAFCKSCRLLFAPQSPLIVKHAHFLSDKFLLFFLFHLVVFFFVASCFADSLLLKLPIAI